MALATRSKPRRPPSTGSSISAPIGGLNARDSLAAMPPQDAVVLDNWFPGPTTVDLRKGSIVQSSGGDGTFETLAPYTSASTVKLFGFTNAGSLYDVTGLTAISIATGLANGRWQHANMGTPGGQFLLAVNGANKLRGYNGAAWWIDGDGTHDITGFDTSTAIHINIFKQRVWFIKSGSLSAYYLPIQSISGAAVQFDLSAYFRLGGYLQAMMTWTVDNAAGINEYAVFISSEGEVAVYEGTDPGSAATWALVGMFHIGRPVGRRCFAKLGSDVAILCSDGVFPLSKALLTDRYQLQDALTNKIVNLVNADVALYSTAFGWQLLLFPLGNKFIVNVPATDGVRQYVMNTITGAWCRFLNWTAWSWATVQDALYFGSTGGVVYKADYGNADVLNSITGAVLPAFQYFGSPGQLKRWTMSRPIFNNPGRVSPIAQLNVDFDLTPPTGLPTFTGSSGTPWNTAKWNTFPWARGGAILKDWIGVNGVGYAGALYMKAAASSPLSWMSVDYVYEKGSIL